MFSAEKNHIEFGVDPDINVSMLQSDIEKNKDTIIETARSLIKEY